MYLLFQAYTVYKAFVPSASGSGDCFILCWTVSIKLTEEKWWKRNILFACNIFALWHIMKYSFQKIIWTKIEIITYLWI